MLKGLRSLLYGVLIPCAILILLCGCSKSKEIADVSLSAKTPYFTSLAEMESEADVIILGQKVDEAFMLYHENGPFATISNFRIASIVKDKTGNLRAGDLIYVLENEFYDEQAKTRYHIADYTAMNTSDEYVLHLSANHKENYDYYTPLAVNFGVTSLGDQYQMLHYKDSSSASGEFDLINSIREEVRNKYK